MNAAQAPIVRIQPHGFIRTQTGLFYSAALKAHRRWRVRVSFGRDAGHVYVWTLNGRRVITRAWRVGLGAPLGPTKHRMHSDADLAFWGRFFTLYRLAERGMRFEAFIANPQHWRSRFKAEEALNAHRGLLPAQQRVADKLHRADRITRMARIAQQVH